MLKKLVKYGNSNALILDKAILELLNIEEGSIVKIKTDGTSIIITPQIKVAVEKVSETYTHNEALIDANIAEGFKKYTNIDKSTQEKLEKEMQTLTKKHQELYAQINNNPEYIEEILQKTKELGTTNLPVLLAAQKAIRDTYSPLLAEVEKELMDFPNKYKLSISPSHEPMTTPSEEQQKEMQQKFLAAHTKNAHIYTKYGELLNNPEYQNQAQLIAEKYDMQKNSSEYLQAMSELNDTYCPEFRQAQEELKAIGEEYTKAMTK